MAEYLSGELWFCISRYDFDVWKRLIRTVKVFWLYVQQNGGGKLTEKMFGRVVFYTREIGWRVSKFLYRYGNLPYSIRKDGFIWNDSRGNEKPYTLYGERINYGTKKYSDDGCYVPRKIYFSYNGSYSYSVGKYYEDGNLESDDYHCYRSKSGTVIRYDPRGIQMHRPKSVIAIGDEGSLIYLGRLMRIMLPGHLYPNGHFSI